MSYEVLWTRILLFSFNSTVHAFSLILATYLAGLALGSYAFRRVERCYDRVRALVVTQILAGLSAAVLAPASAHAASIITGLSARFGYTPGVFLAALALSSSLVILLPATLMGLVLPLSMRLLLDDIERSGQTVGAAYLANTGGAVLGSVLTGFGLIPLLGLKGTLLLLVSVQVATGASLLPWCPVARSTRRRILAGSAAAVVALGALLTALLRGPAPFDRLDPPPSGPSPVVAAHRDGVAASVSVVDYGGAGRVLRIDGFAAALGRPRGGYMAMMTHIPMLVHPQPRRLLVVCFGTGTTAGTALLYPGAQADVVDIDRTVFEFAPYFRDANRDVGRSPRVRLVADDGRNYLLTSRDRYDVITAEPMPPAFSGMASLYSREYYLLAREHLAPGGVVVQWLPMHLLSVAQSLGILRTVQDVFPETTLWVFENTGIVVARRDTPVSVDLPRLRGRMEAPDLRSDLERLGLADAEDFVDLHVLGPDAVRRLTARARLVTDDRPWIEFDAPRHTLRPSWGGFRLEQARTLQMVFTERLREPVSVSGASPAEAAAVMERRGVSSRLMLGDLAAAFGTATDAQALYAEAVARAREPRTRVVALCHLAEIARREGRLAEARALVEESLRLAPAAPRALELQASLTTAVEG
jgi:spermidine synthase